MLISKTRQVWLRKFWLVIAIVSNLSVLGVYKYLGFFTETLNFIFNVTIPVVKLSMPIGISFFTFQTMSYVIDVYRGDADVQKSFFRLLLYVSFFPQLVAGPIVRYKDIEMQLSDRQVSLEKLNDGMSRFSVGLVKKVLIADCCDTADNGSAQSQRRDICGKMGGGAVLHLAAVLRLLGIFRYGDRTWQNVWV